MRQLAKSVALPCLVALAAHADWTLTRYPVAAPDSAAAHRIYGISTFSNAASATSVKVQDSAVRFHADLASDSTAGFTANAGLIHSLSVPEAAWDLSDVTGISFQFKSSVPIPGGLEIILGSDAYTDRQREAGAVFKAVLRGSSVTSAQSDWSTVSLDIKDFYAEGLDYDSLPRMAQVLQKLTHLRISPNTTYRDSGVVGDKPCGKCVNPDLPRIDLEVRRIVLVGISSLFSWPNPKAIGCERALPSVRLEDFADGDEKNELDGYWYVSQDSGNANSAADLANPAKGSSRAQLAIDKSAGGDIGLATFSARLDRRLGNAWHANAGWASLGTGFAGDAGISYLAGSLAAFQFRLGLIARSPTIEKVRFFVSMAGVPDSLGLAVELPAADLQIEEGRTVCVRPEDFRQPSGVAPSQRAVFDWRKMMRLEWRLAMSGEQGGAADTASAILWLADVRLNGLYRVFGVHRANAVSGELAVQVGQGQLRLSGYQGFSALEVVSLQGCTLATFAPQANVALSLPRGTYHLVGRRDGVRVAKVFSVVR